MLKIETKKKNNDYINQQTIKLTVISINGCSQKSVTSAYRFEIPKLTLLPRSIYLTATSSLVCLSVISLATPKFPDPISRTKSYRSLSCMIGISIAGPTLTAARSISTKKNQKESDFAYQTRSH